MADVADVALMGFAVQLPFHGSVQVVVEVPEDEGSTVGCGMR